MNYTLSGNPLRVFFSPSCWCASCDLFSSVSGFDDARQPFLPFRKDVNHTIPLYTQCKFSVRGDDAISTLFYSSLPAFSFRLLRNDFALGLAASRPVRELIAAKAFRLWLRRRRHPQVSDSENIRIADGPVGARKYVAMKAGKLREADAKRCRVVESLLISHGGSACNDLWQERGLSDRHRAPTETGRQRQREEEDGEEEEEVVCVEVPVVQGKTDRASAGVTVQIGVEAEVATWVGDGAVSGGVAAFHQSVSSTEKRRKKRARKSSSSRNASSGSETARSEPFSRRGNTEAMASNTTSTSTSTSFSTSFSTSATGDGRSTVASAGSWSSGGGSVEETRGKNCVAEKSCRREAKARRLWAREVAANEKRYEEAERLFKARRKQLMDWIVHKQDAGEDDAAELPLPPE